MSSAATSIQGGNLSENSLESAVDDVTDATKTSRDDLKDAGKPDTADGQKAKGVVDQLAGEIEDGAQKIETPSTTPRAVFSRRSRRSPAPSPRWEIRSAPPSTSWSSSTRQAELNDA